MVAYMEKAQATEALVDYFLQQKAPIEMLGALFGLSRDTVVERRRVLGVKVRTGRAKSATPEQELAAWHVLQELDKAPDTLDADDWAELYQRCRIPLQQLWRIVKSWPANRVVRQVGQ